MNMAKVRFVLLGIICVLLVALTSMGVAYAPATAPAFPPACENVPSWHLKGVRIYLWPLNPNRPVTTSVPLNEFSFVAHGTYLDEWSTRTAAEKQTLYAYGSNFKLWIDGRRVPLLMDICYEAAYDVADKIFYVQFLPYQWRGPHTFHGEWRSLTGTEPPFVQNTVVVTFFLPPP